MSGIDTIDNNSKAELISSASLAPALAPAPQFDPEDYRADIADLAMTEEQEVEFLHTLWSIMGHFARLGHSVDLCGLIFAEFNEASASAPENGTLLPSTNMESASKPDGGSA
ncbi:hypothetical protein ACVNHC_03345 [Pannonibacter sp. Q-1]